MFDNNNYVIIVTTTNSEEMAEKISNYLLNEGLCACVQFNKITSMHTWDGKREKSTEYRLFINTTTNLIEEVEYAIKEIHNYKLPQIIAIPATYASKEYGSWVNESTRARNSKV